MSKAQILLVDDQPINLEILSEYLRDEGYRLCIARDGQEAWELLEKNPLNFHALLLDRMMPRMDGMEVLARMKQHDELRMVPVIMQTAKASQEEIVEGLEGGAHYYLTKPYRKEMLRAIVRTAVDDYNNYRAIRDRSREAQDKAVDSVLSMRLMDSGQFRFQTIKQAQDLAALLSHSCPDPERVVLGLSELLINAVEHGNLGITYEDKSRLLKNRDDWWQEVHRRQSLPENCQKWGRIRFTKSEDRLEILIQDEGNGFDWRGFLEFDQARAFDSHGRGIAMAKMLSFDRLEYHDPGNTVVVRVNLPPKSE
ncbi:response regulator receiver protein [Magnetococcus marinus MC-1]|uniref:Response regulator receiver protein n=1 Tax=Magnetococcus marinus (strain ATCC BAA-1437 / JCM 17883 / MC-1) TaxID=156889 RepID=A0L475_MAGMM|nr:response regulator [Magnetococcus marinus]ABK42768.1 response regulator receiver protein [Magnetococcus marinus MC-1]